MYENKTIINYLIKNNIFRYGTDLEIRSLKFSDAGTESRVLCLKWLPFINSPRRSFGLVKITNSKVEHPFAEYPEIAKLELIGSPYLLDEKSNYFLNNHPYIDINVQRFCNSRDKFLSNPNNGAIVLPADKSDEFINDMLAYADGQKKRFFANGFKRFAMENAIRLQK